jgi:hypothetical protein
LRSYLLNAPLLVDKRFLLRSSLRELKNLLHLFSPKNLPLRSLINQLKTLSRTANKLLWKATKHALTKLLNPKLKPWANMENREMGAWLHLSHKVRNAFPKLLRNTKNARMLQKLKMQRSKLKKTLWPRRQRKLLMPLQPRRQPLKLKPNKKLKI